MQGKRLVHLFALGALLAGLLAAAPTAIAKTYRPDKRGDGTSGLTLRKAVIAANARAGADKIVLEGGKTYKLAINGIESEDSPSVPAVRDLDIQDPTGSGLTILSSGERLATVDAQGIDRVFDCWSSCKFVRLKIRGGNNTVGGEDGGGINSEGGRISLKLSRVVGNRSVSQGGGIATDVGGLSVSRSVISGNIAGSEGGGIEVSEGPASISKSTIKSNVTSGNGGGAFTSAVLSVKDSTISSNTSFGGEGGGAIFNSDGNLNLVNSTLANNAAAGPGGDGGGFETIGGAVSMNAVTIARNRAEESAGGFARDGGGLFVRNSLIALNAAPADPDCFDMSADVQVSLGHNLLGNASNCSSFIVGPGDIFNPSPSTIKIGQLKDNGGLTKTIALKKGSVAINHAGSDAPKRDQRGEKRKKPDIGAFERL
jgi:hypothetical protein